MVASRFIILQMTESFYGRETLNLTDILMKELPSILNWALDGRERLKHRGIFVQPKSAANSVQELENLSSPIIAFVRDRCVIGPEYEVLSASLYGEWKAWCEGQGQTYIGNKASFGRDLNAAVPKLRKVQHRINGSRLWHYQGIDIE